MFIEPLTDRREIKPGAANPAAINIYTREVANHLVTVVGETHAAAYAHRDRVEFKALIGDNTCIRALVFLLRRSWFDSALAQLKISPAW